MNLDGLGSTVRNPVVSATVPDWEREKKKLGSWHPSKSLLASIRSYQKHRSKKNTWPWLVSRIAILRHRFWAVVTGADIPLNSQIGGGLLLPHPSGIVIHPESAIGPNCLVFQQVTIGATTKGHPTIGGHVDIGAGAKIVGPVTIGDHVRIGANAVVTFDVPDGQIVAAPISSVVTPRN